MKLPFRDELFNTQFLRALIPIQNDEAGIPECQGTAIRIKEPDTGSWYNEWMDTADNVSVLAEQYALSGQPIIARQTFLRAANYYRTAYTFLLQQPIVEPLIRAYDAQTGAFKKAAALMEIPPLFFSAPYHDIQLPACLYPSYNKEHPLLIITGGYDSTIEELYTSHVKAVQEAGYHCLCFEGPGQGAPLFKHNMGFQPGWEQVVQKVIDQTILSGNTHTNKIAIMGLAFGGYLALRAAAGEPRIKACITDAEQYNLYEPVESILPGCLKNDLESTNPLKQKIVHALFRQALRHPLRGYELRKVLLVHGASSVEAYLSIIKTYNLEGHIEKVNCPVLLCDAETTSKNIITGISAGQPEYVSAYAKFTGKKGETIYRQITNPTLFHKRVFDWLDKTINSR